jgi:N-acetylmuramoyl-L-alanine amidase
MRVFLVSLLLCGLGAASVSAYQQELIPVIHEINTSSAPSVSEWKTFVRIADYGGASYVALVQVAELFNGHLRWRPVSKGVDLSVHNQTIRFSDNSSRAWINGRLHTLIQPTVKNEDGFWVPVSFFASSAFFRSTRTKLEWPPQKSSSPAAAGRGSMDSPPKTAGNDEKGSPEPPIPAFPHEEGRSSEASRPIAAHAIRRIVIDPGHGGKDPGAVGPHGIEEKAVNLVLAQDLADVLRQDDGYEVLLTRMDDTFIPLEERAQLANRHNADLFISIHCNASLSSKLKGFEVYFLSEEASDPHADAVARLENAPLALEGKQAPPSPKQVKAVLRSLVKNANINEASELGSLIDHHLGQRLSEPSLGVKQAAFYVLRGAEMPAVLVETGFISNVQEERLLQDAAFRQKLVEGLAAGIVAYDERKQKERG